ncbi:MAG: MTAP family purine nucleoside phosphorylase [Pseudomonadota bacterium]
MLAVIGGTGLYKLDQINIVKEHAITTPFGDPSAVIIEGDVFNRKVLFLPRHGAHHQLLPHEVNYRANIWALKRLGASHVIGVSATGSLQKEIAPGDISLPSQYFDFVKGNREKTFFGRGVAAHVSTAEPTCHELANALDNAAQAIGIELHRDKTYGCVDGPRLGTKAESFFLRGPAGCDLVGMTNVPEVFLAREAQIAYCTVAIATDYDCWQDDPSLHVSVEQVISRYGESLEKAKRLLLAFIEGPFALERNACHTALSSALLTPVETLSEEQREWMDVLLR